jgi:agarase
VRNKPDRRIVEAAGRHCDVVSVNSYDLWPRREQFGQWHEECGRPIQIGEFCFALSSPRMVPAPWPNFTPEERHKLYTQLYEKWMDQPWAVGAHWFTYEDMIGTGRPLGDGGNQPGGFVDIADQPHEELVRASLEATAKMYEWHGRAE